jgi:hypothetical protein
MLATTVPRVAAAVAEHLAAPPMAVFANLEKVQRFTARRAQMLAD